MSIPFSNTNLRIPRGFGNILEGLAREVLRHQPDDIPAFAALYFNALLKEREESGMDPAEWGARLEDRFYNNHAFKQDIEKDVSASAEQEPAPAEPLNESSTPEPLGIIESEIIQPVHIKTVATANFDVFGDVPGVENWGVDGSGSQADKDICSAELGPEPSTSGSYGGVANVDICAEELRPAEGGGTAIEMDLSAALLSPMPQPEGGAPRESHKSMPGSPESLLLDFGTGSINTPERMPRRMALKRWRLWVRMEGRRGTGRVLLYSRQQRALISHLGKSTWRVQVQLRTNPKLRFQQEKRTFCTWTQKWKPKRTHP
ncbi:hypothetical protein MATL_G00123850 [Megalops atlanticus]|uniref:RIIa domain-containing protein n=1 Tax=Megalops atlanticus TaxID=7932 RepID=A0A9D3T5Z2_MEGAT|nr:hypothetical protein MATL_G00123850 [Megalops atlanticus]